MPHVIVKLYTGKSERQKQALAQAVTEAVTNALNHGEESVSVDIEDVDPQDWTTKVYKPDIIDKPDIIYKKPGYAHVRCTEGVSHGHRYQKKRLSTFSERPGRLVHRHSPHRPAIPGS